MSFKRTIDEGYPHVYETWSARDSTFMTQDIPPEDIDAAIEILLEVMVNDEPLCVLHNVKEDPPSIVHAEEFWREILPRQMSLGCYVEKNGKKTLVALNVCAAFRVDDDTGAEVKGEKWKHVIDGIMYTQNKKVNSFEYMGLDLILFGMGLVVKKEYRGLKLGQKILNAREPLCKSQGIKATATVFTGPVSQKVAASCGFQTIAEVTYRELADVGYPYPRDESRSLKLMIKKYF